MDKFEAWMGIVGIIVPLALWAGRIHWMVRRTLNMHEDPDRYGFGARETNKLLREHIDGQNELRAATLQALTDLNRVIAELSHYIRWSTEQTCHKKPPPFVGNG